MATTSNRIGLEGYLDLTKFDQQVEKYNKCLNTVKQGLSDFERALLSLIEKERNNKIGDLAEKQFKKMTMAQKEAVTQNLLLKQSAYEAEEALKREANAASKMGEGESKGLKIFGMDMMNLWATVQLVGAGIQKAMDTMKQVYDFGKEVAQIDLLEYRFKRLATSVGADSTILLSSLRDVTKGTRSDLDLMQGSLDLMSLGLAKNSDEVIRLTRLQAALGMDTNNLVLAITNQTTRRFDQLGISVDGFKERLDGLKATGLSAEDAFKEAFLQQAEAQLERIGSVTETTAGKFSKFEASVANMEHAIKIRFLPAAQEMIDILLDIVTEGGRYDDQYNKVRQTSLQAGDSLDAVNASFYEQMKALGFLIGPMGEIRLKSGAIVEGYHAWTQAELDLIKAHKSHVASMEASKKKHAEWLDGAEGITSAVPKVNGVQEAIAKLAWDGEKALGSLKTAFEGTFGKDFETYKEKTKKLEDEVFGFSQELKTLEALPVLTPEQVKKVEELRGKIQEARGQIVGLATDFEESSKRMVYSMILTQASMDGLTKNEFGNLLKLGQAWGVLDERTAAIAADINNLNLDDANLKMQDFDNILQKAGTTTATPKVILEGQMKIGGKTYTDYEDFSEAMWGKGGGHKVTEEKVVPVVPVVEPTGFAKVEYLTEKVPQTQTKRIVADTQLDDFEYQKIMRMLGASDKTITIYTRHIERWGGESFGANGLDMVIPPGFPNDSYRVNVSSGERVVVIPDTGSVSNSTSVVNNYYNNRSYNLGVNTMQSPSVVQRSFDIMRILNGG